MGKIRAILGLGMIGLGGYLCLADGPRFLEHYTRQEREDPAVTANKIIESNKKKGKEKIEEIVTDSEVIEVAGEDKSQIYGAYAGAGIVLMITGAFVAGARTTNIRDIGKRPKEKDEKENFSQYRRRMVDGDESYSRSK